MTFFRKRKYVEVFPGYFMDTHVCSFVKIEKKRKKSFSRNSGWKHPPRSSFMCVWAEERAPSPFSSFSFFWSSSAPPDTTYIFFGAKKKRWRRKGKAREANLTLSLDCWSCAGEEVAASSSWCHFYYSCVHYFILYSGISIHSPKNSWAFR